MVLTHYRAFRKIPFFKRARINYIPENNLAHEGAWIANLLMESELFENVAVLKEHPGQIGFHTDENSKLRRARHMRECFNMDRVVMCEDIVTVNTDPKKTRQIVTNTLIEQMEFLREYRRLSISRDTTYVTALFTEANKRIPNRKDDAVQALMVILDVVELFMGGKLPPAMIKKEAPEAKNVSLANKNLHTRLASHLNEQNEHSGTKKFKETVFDGFE